jgi:GT2 family glycosyltransferase
MPANPLVSVIIPAWNAATTLAETLASVSAQTVRDIEILVIDDGSTDETASIATAAAGRDSRIKVIRQANAGVAAARNAGLMQAKAPHAAWLDSDDLWHPLKLERQLEVLDKATEPLVFVYTGYRMIDAAGRIQPLPRTIADLSGSSLLRQIATTQFTNVSTFLAPTRLARALGGHDPSLRGAGLEGAEDLLLQLRLAAHGCAGFVPEALVGYRMHGANMSRAVARAARSNVLALEKLRTEHPGLPEWVWRLGHGRMAGFALQMAAAGSPLEAARFLKLLLERAPLETVATLARSLPFLLRDWLRLRPRDPELGRLFLEADPTTLPIEGHMLLSRRAEARLRDADLKRAAEMPERTRRSRPEEVA